LHCTFFFLFLTVLRLTTKKIILSRTIDENGLYTAQVYPLPDLRVLDITSGFCRHFHIPFI
jgi:hypothetical protein